MKIFLLGGTGKLGRRLVEVLKRKNIDFFSPTHPECEIEDIEQIRKYVEMERPNVILHSAGFVNTLKSEVNRERCVEVNVLGTYNIVQLCREYKIRLVYISTEYVFSGKEDVYIPSSSIDPKNIYGLTKGCGELIVRTLNDYIVIRAPFIRDVEFPYEDAFTNQHTSRQYVHEITEDIINCSVSNEIGIKHIVGKYQSVYELAKETNSEVSGVEVSSDLEKIIPLNLNLKEK